MRCPICCQDSDEIGGSHDGMFVDSDVMMPLLELFEACKRSSDPVVKVQADDLDIGLERMLLYRMYQRVNMDSDCQSGEQPSVE